MAEGRDVATLFHRLADTLVRLMSDRFELARVELREEAERLLAVAAIILLGAAAAAVGLVMLALAATDLLAPLVVSRAGRLALVGGPLCAAGAWQVIKAARDLPGRIPPPALEDEPPSPSPPSREIPPVE
jgi:uncharacterized membrane protein YqjE